jgi:hypothetical protein
MGFKINWGNRGVIIEFKDTLTFQLTLKVADRLVGNRHFETLLFQVWDLRDVTRVTLQKEDAKPLGILARSSTVWSKKQHIAILVKTNPNVEIFCKIFQHALSTTQWKCSLFQEKSEMIDCLRSELGNDVVDSSMVLFDDLKMVPH